MMVVDESPRLQANGLRVTESTTSTPTCIMPPLHSAPTLTYLSTRGLVTYLTRIWRGEEHDVIIAILKRISIKYLREVLEIMARTERITNNHVVLLFDSRFKEFNFNGHGKAVFDDNEFVRRLYTTCPQLNVVCMPFHTNVSPHTWCHMLNNLNNLQRLDLSGTTCNDRVMEEVAGNCPQLEHLLVCGTEVTNGGLSALYETEPGCRDLLSLDVSSTRVTVEGVGAALMQLRQLQELEVDKICLVLSRLHRDYIRGSQVPPDQQHNLQRGCVTVLGEHANHIWVLCAHCPQIRDLEVYGEVYDGCLPAIYPLRSLENLYVENEDQTVTLNGLASLLHEVGGHLHQLTLVEFEANALWVVLQHCRNLQRLIFQPLGMPLLSTPRDTTLLEALGRLVELDLALSDITTYTLDESLLVLVLGSCVNVEVLALTRIVALTDVTLKKAIEINTFARLRNVSLQRCHEITKCGLLHLVHVAPKLTQMFLGRCGRVDFLDVLDLEEEAEMKCWDFRIYVHTR